MRRSSPRAGDRPCPAAAARVPARTMRVMGARPQRLIQLLEVYAAAAVPVNLVKQRIDFDGRLR